MSTAVILTQKPVLLDIHLPMSRGRLGAFCSPYLIGTDNPIKSVGVTMLVIHFITALCAWNLPESKGKDLSKPGLRLTLCDTAEDSPSHFQRQRPWPYFA